MLDVIIKVRVLSGAEDEIIGIKESLSNEIERWGWVDVVSIDVKPVEKPQKIKLGNVIRDKLTKDKVEYELKAKNITLEEMQEIIAAIIDLQKLDIKENSEWILKE